MQKIWKPGDIVAMRGIYDQRVWSAQPAIIIKDSPEEVIFAILPGAECKMCIRDRPVWATELMKNYW